MPTWLHLPSRNPPKPFPKPIPGGINFLIDFWMDFLPILVPTWDQKSMLTLKAENQLNASRLAFSWLSGLEVGSQNRPKIDQKTESKMDGILASIFLRFGSILGAKLGGKPEPRSTQKSENDAKKKQKPDCQKSRNMNPSRLAAPRFLSPGRG